MPDKITWRQPKADEHLARRRSVPTLLRLLRFWAITWLILLPPTLYVVRRYAPGDFWRTAIGGVVLVLAVPLHPALLAILPSPAAYAVAAGY